MQRHDNIIHHETIYITDSWTIILKHDSVSFLTEEELDYQRDRGRLHTRVQKIRKRIEKVNAIRRQETSIW